MNMSLMNIVFSGAQQYPGCMPSLVHSLTDYYYMLLRQFLHNLTTVAKWPTTVHLRSHSTDLVHTPHTGYNTTILLLLIWYHLPSNVPLPNEFMYGSNVVMFSLDAGNQQGLLLLRDNFLGDEFSITPPPGIWVPKHVGTSESWVILIYSFHVSPLSVLYCLNYSWGA